MQNFSGTLMPFLYPCLGKGSKRAVYALRHASLWPKSNDRVQCQHRRWNSVATSTESGHFNEAALEHASQDDPLAHLNPSPESYSNTPFTDHCSITLQAGSGGHGCISFLREKYIANGPANGGDGGTGGSIYIQAVKGETSLHKLARRGILKASRGRNGQGKNQGGERGEDMVIQVPLGTVVREIWRHDPAEVEELAEKRARGYGSDMPSEEEPSKTDKSKKWRRDKWLLYPGALPSSFTSADFPALPRPRRSNLSTSQPQAPIKLDLDTAMDAPMLLAAGAVGGLGNPHYVTKSIPRPKFATKGEEGMRLEVQLELKLLADVGLVGLPNAGKSTLLRALSNSRTRVGSWAFTTLQPNIGTVVLDDYKGRPRLSPSGKRKEPRTNFTIADIPGLIEDAHLDRGLGLGFLRHIERAAVLAFVVDLSAGDAITALKGLWREVGQYELLRDRELNEQTERRIEEQNDVVEFRPFDSRPPREISEGDSMVMSPSEGRQLPPLTMPPISSKPWLVIATKADLQETRDNFAKLQNYLKAVEEGREEHPSGKKNAWCTKISGIPVSAIRAEGVEAIAPTVVDLLEA